MQADVMGGCDGQTGWQTGWQTGQAAETGG